MLIGFREKIGGCEVSVLVVNTRGHVEYVQCYVEFLMQNIRELCACKLDENFDEMDCVSPQGINIISGARFLALELICVGYRREEDGERTARCL